MVEWVSILGVGIKRKKWSGYVMGVGIKRKKWSGYVMGWSGYKTQKVEWVCSGVEWV